MGQQNDPSLISERTVLGRSCTHSCTEQMYTQLYLGTGSEQMYTQLSKCVHTVLIILANGKFWDAYTQGPDILEFHLGSRPWGR